MNKLARYSKVFLKRNSSTILSIVGAAGVVATAVSAVKATPKALDILEDTEHNKGEKLTKLEKVRYAGPVYIPSVLLAATTIACIFGANVLNKKQQAALVSAYTLLDQSFKEYKNKAADLYGEEANKNIRTEIAKDHYKEEDFKPNEKKLYLDFFSGARFEATSEDVLRAEYELNKALFADEFVCVNDFYELLGLERIPEYEEVGWNCMHLYDSYMTPWVDFEHETIVMEDGLEFEVVNMSFEPYVGYQNYL